MKKNRYGILFKEFYPCLILLHFIFYHRKFESKPNKYRIIYIYTYISFLDRPHTLFCLLLINKQAPLLTKNNF